jgi:hypothetical protein
MRFDDKTTVTLPVVSILSACLTEMIRMGSKHEFSKSTGFLVNIRITCSGAEAGFLSAAYPYRGSAYQLSCKGPAL